MPSTVFSCFFLTQRLPGQPPNRPSVPKFNSHNRSSAHLISCHTLGHPARPSIRLRPPFCSPATPLQGLTQDWWSPGPVQEQPGSSHHPSSSVKHSQRRTHRQVLTKSTPWLGVSTRKPTASTLYQILRSFPRPRTHAHTYTNTIIYLSQIQRVLREPQNHTKPSIPNEAALGRRSDQSTKPKGAAITHPVHGRRDTYTIS